MNGAWWRQQAVKQEHAHRHSKQQQQHKSSRPRGADGSAFVACPVCGQQVPLATVNQHLDGPCPGPVCNRTTGSGATDAHAVAEYDTGPAAAEPSHPGGGGGGVALAYGAGEVSAKPSSPQHSFRQHNSCRMAADSPSTGTSTGGAGGCTQAARDGTCPGTGMCQGAHSNAAVFPVSDVTQLESEARGTAEARGEGQGDTSEEVEVVEITAGQCQATGAAVRCPAGPMGGAPGTVGVDVALHPRKALGSTATTRTAGWTLDEAGMCLDQAGFEHHAKRRRLEHGGSTEQLQPQPPLGAPYGDGEQDLVGGGGQTAGGLLQGGWGRNRDSFVGGLQAAGTGDSERRAAALGTGLAPTGADPGISPASYPCKLADESAGQRTAEVGLTSGTAELAAAAPAAEAGAASSPVDAHRATAPAAAEWWRAAALRQRKQQQLHALQRPVSATSLHSEHQAQQTHTEAVASPAPALPALPLGVGPPGPDGMLMPVPHAVPEGGFLLPSFVSPEEEQAIVALCDDPRQAPPWQWVTRGTSTHVRAKRWGVLPDYGRRGVAPAQHPLPPPVVAVMERMRTHVALLRDFWPNEANALDYWREKGSVLHPHADDRILSTDIIVTLSLVGRAVMTFELDKGREAERRASRARVHLPPRCLQILSGRARYNYTHGITNGDLLDPRRLSITFRFSPLKPYDKEL